MSAGPRAVFSFAAVWIIGTVGFLSKHGSETVDPLSGALEDQTQVLTDTVDDIIELLLRTMRRYGYKAGFESATIIGLWTLLWTLRTGFIPALLNELAFSKNRPPCRKRNRPKYAYRPDTYPKLLVFWLNPFLSLTVCILMLASILPEVLAVGKPWHFATWPVLKWLKVFVGFWGIPKLMKMMSFLTIDGNDQGTRGQPSLSGGGAMTDAKFIGWVKFVNILSATILSWNILMLYYHDEAQERPKYLKGLDKMFCVHGSFVVISRLICGYERGAFYAVRKPEERWNYSVDRGLVAHILNALQVIVTLEPSTMCDMIGVWERMERRMDDNFCGDWAVVKGRRHPFVPELMQEAMELIEKPIINTIDWWTKIFMRLVKDMQVIPNRLAPLTTDAIKLPFKRTSLPMQEYASIGLKVALMDEQYSKADGNGHLIEGTATTESSPKVMPKVLALYDYVPHIEDPRWFLHEMEGVVTYETLIAPFAAHCNSHWKDLVTDKGVCDLFRWGLGQAFLVGVGCEDAKDAVAQIPSHIRKDTTHLCDYSWAGQYAVRPRCARYGCIACFKYLPHEGDHGELVLLAIYVSHWDWEKYPDQKGAAEYSPPQPWVENPNSTETSSSQVGDREDVQQKRWGHAKYVLKSTLGTFMTIKEHLVWHHWIVSNNASITTREKLERDHPVRRLITPHIVRAPSINYMSTLTLLPESRFVHRASGFHYPAMAQAVMDVMKAFDYSKEGTFPKKVESRKLGNLEKKLPWVQDGKSYWEVVHSYVDAFLAIYYADGAELLHKYDGADVEEWWDSIKYMPSGPEAECEEVLGKRGKTYKMAPGYGYKLPNLQPESTQDSRDLGRNALERLTNYVTHMIFGVTADHELYGSVNQYFVTPMGLTTKIWNEAVPENELDPCGQVMQDCQTFLQALGVISGTGVPMPRLLADWGFLTMVQEGDKDKWTDLKMVKSQIKKVNEFCEILWADSGKKLKRNDSTDRKTKIKEELEKILQPGRVILFYEHEILLKQLHNAFMEHLIGLSFEIQKRNTKRGHPFDEYDPGNLECSISI